MKKQFLLVGLLSLSLVGLAQDEVRELPLDEIVVVGGSPNVFQHQSERLTREQLQMENTGQNLPFILQNTPSMVVTSDDGLGVGYTYFRLRGTDHTRINMTINDVPLNDQESQTVFWVNLTDMVSSVNELSVQRGVGTSVHGSSSFGGSVNMRTLTERPKVDSMVQQRIGGQVDFNGGMYNTFREMAKVGGWLTPQWFMSARLSKVNSDGYLERAKSDLWSYQAEVAWFGPKQQKTLVHTDVQLLLFGGNEQTYMAWYGVSKEQLERNRRFNPAGLYTLENGDTAYYKNQNDHYTQHHVQLHITHRFSRLWDWHTTLHYTFGRGYFEQLYMPKVQQDWLQSHFGGLMSQATYRTDPVDVQFGLALNDFDCLHWGVDYAFMEEQGRANYDAGSELYRGKGNKLDGNIYAKLMWRPIDRVKERLMLYVDAQYRWVDYQITGQNEVNFLPIDMHQVFHFFNPKAGIEYRRRGHHTYATFAIANREPARTNYVQSGSETPTSERLYDYELGYHYKGVAGSGVVGSWEVGLNAYWMQYKNQLVLTGEYSDVGAMLTRNVRDSYRAGIELEWQVDWTRWLRWTGSLCWSRNRIMEWTDHQDVVEASGDWVGQQEVTYRNVAIALSPDWVANTTLSFHYAGFQGDIQTRVVDKQYLDNTMNSDAMLRCYTTTDVLLRYRLPIERTKWPMTELNVRVNNVFNSHYESNGGNYTYRCAEDGVAHACPWYYAQAGINVHAGFSLRW